MRVHVVVILFGIFTFTHSSERADSIYSYLATKSAYRFASNEDINDVTSDESACPQKIWMLLRHGTRNPSTGDINNMNSRLPQIKNIILNANSNNTANQVICQVHDINDEIIPGPLENDELQQIANWVPVVQDVAYQQILVAEGKLENEEISQRMQARFPTLLQSVFDNDTYLIMHTESERTYESARHFAIGLFGEENLQDLYFPEPTYEDLRNIEFYELCTRWHEEIEDNPDSLLERDLFEKSSIFEEVVGKVNQALGLVNELSLKDVLIIYKTCAFEASWFRNATTPWCIPFDLDSIKTIAYAEDLEYYWLDGFGFELNYKQACPAIGDIVNFFEDATTDRKAALYFTHSGAVIKFIARLGLYFDEEPLLHSNFNPDDPNYWQISKIGNFATNVALILHDCGDSKKVSVRHNEHLVRLPACPDSDLCDLEIIKQYFDDSLNDCNFEEICGLL